MRVTNSMLVSNFMNNLNKNLSRMEKLQNQLASTRKFAHISDDPIAVIFSEQANYKLNRLEHYQRNVETANNWLTQAETSAMNINNILQTVYESCIDASTNVKGVYDEKNVAQFLGQMRDEILSVLNSSIGDKYIFGGYNTTGYIGNDGRIVPPFTTEGYSVQVQSRDPITRDLVYHTNMEGKTLYADTGETEKVKVPEYELVIDNSDQPLTTDAGDYVYQQKRDADGNPIYREITAADYNMTPIGTDSNGNYQYIATSTPATVWVPEYVEDTSAAMVNGKYPYVQKENPDGSPAGIWVGYNDDIPVYEKVPQMETITKYDLYYNGYNISRPEKNYEGQGLTDQEMAVEIRNMMSSLREDCLTLDIGIGISMEVTLNGLDLILFGGLDLRSDLTDADILAMSNDDAGKLLGSIQEGMGNNIFNLMDDLYNSVNQGDEVPAISDYIPELQKAQNHVLALVAGIGGRTNRLDMLESRYSQDELNYAQMKSDAEDADMSEVIMKSKMAEAVYQAALATGAKIIQPTLMDFLR